MPESAKIVVAMNTGGKSSVAHMVMSEFEADVVAILYGFNMNNQAFVAIATGKTEPTAPATQPIKKNPSAPLHRACM